MITMNVQRYLNYEFQNIEYQVGNWFSLVENAGETLYLGNYASFILTYEQNCIIFKYVFAHINCSKKIPYCITGI